MPVTLQPTCRLAALICTALIVPLLFLVFVSSSNSYAAPRVRLSRRKLLLNSDVITDGGQGWSQRWPYVGPNSTAGIAHKPASSLPGSEDRFIAAAKPSLPPLAHQIQEKQAKNSKASLISPAPEGYESSLSGESNEDLLLGEVDALVADMMYGTAEYENEMQLNLDIDLPLLLVLEDRDATAEVMEMIEEQVRDLMMTMDPNQATPPSAHSAEHREAKASGYAREAANGQSGDVKGRQEPPIIAPTQQSSHNTFSDNIYSDLPSVHVHEDLHSHSVMTLQQQDGSRTSDSTARQEIDIDDQRESSSPPEFLQSLMVTMKKAPTWVIPVVIGSALLCTGMVGVSKGWFDQHSMDNLEPPRHGRTSRPGTKLGNLAAKNNALSVLDCSSKKIAPEEWPSLHSPRASAIERMRQNQARRTKRMKPEADAKVPDVKASS